MLVAVVVIVCAIAAIVMRETVRYWAAYCVVLLGGYSMMRRPLGFTSVLAMVAPYALLAWQLPKAALAMQAPYCIALLAILGVRALLLYTRSEPVLATREWLRRPGTPAAAAPLLSPQRQKTRGARRA
jgi:hypothetical protein